MKTVFQKIFLVCLILSCALSFTIPAQAADSLAVAGDIQGTRVLSSGSSERLDLVPRGLHDGIFILSSNQFVILDTGEVVTLEKGIKFDVFDSAFGNGLGLVREDTGDLIGGRFGYVDRAGKLVIPCQFGEAFPFSENRAVVRLPSSSDYGVIDTAGNVVVPYGTYYRIERFSEGVAVVWKAGNEEGCIDANGNVVVEIGKYNLGMKLNYDPAFSHGLLRFYEGRASGFINAKGEIVIPAEYGYTTKTFLHFSDGLAVVREIPESEWESGKCGYINTKGELVIKYQFEEAYAFREDYAQTSAGWIDKSGKVLFYGSTWTEEEGESSDYVWGSDLDEQVSDGLIRVNGTGAGVAGYRDTNGKLVVSLPNGAHTTDFEKGRAGVICQDENTPKWNWYIIENPLYQDNKKRTAVPTRSQVYINGGEAALEVYLIDNNNYFKLRDIAYALRGTKAAFDVAFNQEKNRVYLLQGRKYSYVGGEMAPGDGKIKKPLPTTAGLFLQPAGETDRYEAFAISYNIGGNNYFKLRDIARMLNFGVIWDPETNAISIDPDSEYTIGGIN